MRAGKLDKTIVINRGSVTEVDEYGAPSEGWTGVTFARAQLIQSSTEEFLQSFGQSSETAVVFRIRHLDGLTTGDRVIHGGRHFDIKEIRAFGRREGLDLRCVASGA